MLATIVKYIIIAAVLLAMMGTAYLYGHNDGHQKASTQYEQVRIPQERSSAVLEQVKRLHLACALEMPMQFTYDTTVTDRDTYVCLSLGEEPQPNSTPPSQTYPQDKKEKHNKTLI